MKICYTLCLCLEYKFFIVRLINYCLVSFCALLRKTETHQSPYSEKRVVENCACVQLRSVCGRERVGSVVQVTWEC